VEKSDGASLKNHHPTELTDLLAELSQFCPLIAGEHNLLRETELTTVDSCLTNPLNKAAVGQVKPLHQSTAGDALTQAKGNSLCFLLRRKPASRCCVSPSSSAEQLGETLLR
jgi:hypothetical protein